MSGLAGVISTVLIGMAGAGVAGCWAMDIAVASQTKITKLKVTSKLLNVRIIRSPDETFSEGWTVWETNERES
jgi:hypothetical protein